ncbi:MAG: single-stranded-DNA-specific exonuclease RecJ [Aquisalimonadaceae bacterium]
MKRTVRQRPLSVELEQLRDVGMHPVLRRVYAGRRIADADELLLGLDRLEDARTLSGLDQAIDLLAAQVTRGGRVLLVGDFDADGATSCALAVLALRALGLDNVRYLVPNRFTYGYGLTPEIVELAAAHAPDLLVTVDNGISSIEGVSAARERGIQVLVTDHHLPGSALPAADAIVNPNLPDDDFPSKHLAGVGVIFYVLVALRTRLRSLDWFGPDRPEPNLAAYLDLVALGTVADVVPLDRNNRVLVEQGLRRIRAGRCRAGIRALLEVAGREPTQVSTGDLGFAVGPRLNAAGRLEDMSLGIECLLADDDDAARRMAARLDDLNRQRRDIELQMETDALAGLDRLEGRWNGNPPAGLCLMEPDWHQGVIGILASRIKERFNRPVIAFAPAGAELKGSARSIPGLHIRDLLDRIATANSGLIARFGGHAAAAGLSLEPARFEDFRRAFESAAAAAIEPGMLDHALLTDGPLGAADLEIGLARQIKAGGPWGQGFPEPSFDNVFDVVSQRVVGERHLKFELRHPEGGATLEAIAFRALDHGWDSLGARVRAVYRLDVNRWRGSARLQLIMEYMDSAK